MPDGRSVSRRIFVMGSLGSALAAGCGGGNAPSGSPLTSSSGRGAAQFTILWPELKPDSRLIPAAAKSITITLVGPVTVTKTVARPAAGTNQTTVSFPDLEIGSYTATATAYPNVDGTGTAQATGTVSVTITKNQTTTASLTMGTTITKVEVSPTSFTIPTTGTTTLTATARDASNAIVLTGNTWSWSSSDPSKATVAGITTSATVTGVASGSTTITAMETESGKFGSSVGSIGFNQGIGLADTAWPKLYCNQWNRSAISVTRNTSGIEKWKKTFTSPISSYVIGKNDNIYIAESGGKLHVISPDGISNIFFTSHESSTGGVITLGASKIYYANGTWLYCLDESANISWKTQVLINFHSTGLKPYSIYSINIAPDGNLILVVYRSETINNVQKDSISLVSLSASGTLLWT